MGDRASVQIEILSKLILKQGSSMFAQEGNSQGPLETVVCTEEPNRRPARQPEHAGTAGRVSYLGSGDGECAGAHPPNTRGYGIGRVPRALSGNQFA